MIDLYSIIRKPIITKKTSKLINEQKLIFEVIKTSTKYQIKNAIKKVFNLKAVSVRTMITRGKIKRLGNYKGKQKNIKKAIISFEKNIDINKLELMINEK